MGTVVYRSAIKKEEWCPLGAERRHRRKWWRSCPLSLGNQWPQGREYRKSNVTERGNHRSKLTEMGNLDIKSVCALRYALKMTHLIITQIHFISRSSQVETQQNHWDTDKLFHSELCMCSHGHTPTLHLHKSKTIPDGVILYSFLQITECLSPALPKMMKSTNVFSSTSMA